MNIEMYTTNLKNLAENGRLVETYNSKETEYFIAEYPISGDELNKHINAIEKYWVEEEEVLYFGEFHYFNTPNICQEGMWVITRPCKSYTFDENKLYHLCVTLYVRNDKYGYEKKFYNTFIIEDGEDFYKWYSQPVFNYNKVREQYNLYLDNWEIENLPEDVREWIKRGREYDNDVIEEMIDEFGYPVRTNEHPLCFNDWVEKEFYKL